MGTHVGSSKRLLCLLQDLVFECQAKHPVCDISRHASLPLLQNMV